MNGTVQEDFQVLFKDFSRENKERLCSASEGIFRSFVGVKGGHMKPYPVATPRVVGIAKQAKHYCLGDNGTDLITVGVWVFLSEGEIDFGKEGSDNY